MRNDYVFKAKLFELEIQLEAYKAANALSLYRNEPPVYGEHEFGCLSFELENIINKYVTLGEF